MNPHLSGHHRMTIEKIFRHPAGRNIEWRQVLSLLEDLGSVKREQNGKFTVNLGPETEVFEAPRGKDIDKQVTVDLRRMLRQAGWAPDDEAPSPDTLVDIDILRAAVQLACRAPSLHNSQPWRWVAEGVGLHLYVDRDRILPSTDKSGREAHIGCGAMLDHLCVAMAAAGWTANVDRFPDPNNPDHLASLDFSPMGRVTDQHRHRANAIRHRRTDRLPFAAPRNWASFEPLLRNAVDAKAVHLDVIAEARRSELARASRLTESLRLYDSSYHTELNWWTGHFENSDGIPSSSLLSAAENDRVDVGRTFPVSAHNERPVGIGQDQSTVLVLSTDEDGRDDALRCGEALSAVLLECTLAGMATCTLSHLTELESSRHLIGTLTGRTAMPQLLIRVGEARVGGEVPPATPRRPVQDVLSFPRDTDG